MGFGHQKRHAGHAGDLAMRLRRADRGRFQDPSGSYRECMMPRILPARAISPTRPGGHGSLPVRNPPGYAMHPPKQEVLTQEQESYGPASEMEGTRRSNLFAPVHGFPSPLLAGGGGIPSPRSTGAGLPRNIGSGVSIAAHAFFISCAHSPSETSYAAFMHIYEPPAYGAR